jgi:adenosine deaminase
MSATIPGTPLPFEMIRAAPKVLLHDHLDGGLRPTTIVDLAREHGYHDLPTEDAGDLAAWFRRGADRKRLELYLETFAHTTGVMQHPDAIARVAAECAEDLAEDGVVYAEVRYAPELSTRAGLTVDEAIGAVLDGVREGEARAAAAGRPIVVRFLVTAMRDADRSLEVAQAAIRWRDAGVVGFDIAGPEAGYPPSLHRPAFDLLRRAAMRITIHAGEADGLGSIRAALVDGGAERLGHGLRIADDITSADGEPPRLGRLATYVRDRQVALELCPTSNVHIGAVASVAAIPIGLLLELGLRVTINTDNRLMSGVTASSELAAVDAAFGLGVAGLERLAVDALDAAFLPLPERRRLVDEVVRPGHARLAPGVSRPRPGARP